MQRLESRTLTDLLLHCKHTGSPDLYCVQASLLLPVPPAAPVAHTPFAASLANGQGPAVPRFFIPTAPVAASTTPHAPNVRGSDLLPAAEPSLDNNICSDHEVDPETEGVQAGIANGLLGSSATPEALPSPRGDNILDAGESDGWPLRAEHDPLLTGLELPFMSCGFQGGTCMLEDVH